MAVKMARGSSSFHWYLKVTEVSVQWLLNTEFTSKVTFERNAEADRQREYNTVQSRLHIYVVLQRQPDVSNWIRAGTKKKWSKHVITDKLTFNKNVEKLIIQKQLSDISCTRDRNRQLLVKWYEYAYGNLPEQLGSLCPAFQGHSRSSEWRQINRIPTNVP